MQSLHHRNRFVEMNHHLTLLVSVLELQMVQTHIQTGMYAMFDGIREHCLPFVTESKTCSACAAVNAVLYQFGETGSMFQDIHRKSNLSRKRHWALSLISLCAFSALDISGFEFSLVPTEGLRCCLWTKLFPLTLFPYLLFSMLSCSFLL